MEKGFAIMDGTTGRSDLLQERSELLQENSDLGRENGAITAVLLANTGIMLSYMGINVLVDAIYEDEGHPFSRVPEETWENLLEGRGPFRKIDYLLFTHTHEDHFSEGKLIRFLRHRQRLMELQGQEQDGRHLRGESPEQEGPEGPHVPQKERISPVKGIVLPEDALEMTDLTAALEETGVPAFYLSGDTDRIVIRPEPHLEIRAKKMRHLDKVYYQIPHFCYLLNFDERKVLITADVDYTHYDFHEFPKDIDIAFVNPLFFGELGYRRFYHGELKAETFAVYHVPFEPDDSMNMRHLLQRRIERWEARCGRVIAFTEPGQSFEL